MTPAKVRFVQLPALLGARSLISLPFLVSLDTGAASRHKGSVITQEVPQSQRQSLLPMEQVSAKALKYGKNLPGSSALKSQCLFKKV